MGRWAEAKTSTVYINEAMAVLGQHTVTNCGISKIERCVRVFTHTLSQYPQFVLAKFKDVSFNLRVLTLIIPVFNKEDL